MFIPFPDETAYPRSQDGSEPIRGGSVGFNNILGRFVKTAKTDRRPLTGCFVINAATVFRNVFHPDDKFSDTVAKWEKDIHLFVTYFQSYLSYVYQGNEPLKPTPIIVYLPDYRVLPSVNRRAMTGRAEALWKQYAAFLKEYNQDAESVFSNPYIDQWIMSVGKTRFPHQELNTWLDLYATKHDTTFRADRRLMMISHILLDYHMCVRKPFLQVLESYTAETMSSPDFRFKLDKSGILPFNAITHLTFGDSTLVANQLRPKMSRLLHERATQERWLMKSPSAIKMSIQSATNLPSTIFSANLS